MTEFPHLSLLTMALSLGIAAGCRNETPVFNEQAMEPIAVSVSETAPVPEAGGRDNVFTIEEEPAAETDSSKSVLAETTLQEPGRGRPDAYVGHEDQAATDSAGKSEDNRQGEEQKIADSRPGEGQKSEESSRPSDDHGSEPSPTESPSSPLAGTDSIPSVPSAGTDSIPSVPSAGSDSNPSIPSAGTDGNDSKLAEGDDDHDDEHDGDDDHGDNHGNNHGNNHGDAKDIAKTCSQHFKGLASKLIVLSAGDSVQSLTLGPDTVLAVSLTGNKSSLNLALGSGQALAGVCFVLRGNESSVQFTSASQVKKMVYLAAGNQSRGQIRFTNGLEASRIELAGNAADLSLSGVDQSVCDSARLKSKSGTIRCSP